MYLSLWIFSLESTYICSAVVLGEPLVRAMSITNVSSNNELRWPEQRPTSSTKAFWKGTSHESLLCYSSSDHSSVMVLILISSSLIAVSPGTELTIKKSAETLRKRFNWVLVRLLHHLVSSGPPSICSSVSQVLH